MYFHINHHSSFLFCRKDGCAFTSNDTFAAVLFGTSVNKWAPHPVLFQLVPCHRWGICSLAWLFVTSIRSFVKGYSFIDFFCCYWLNCFVFVETVVFSFVSVFCLLRFFSLDIKEEEKLFPSLLLSCFYSCSSSSRSQNTSSRLIAPHCTCTYLSLCCLAWHSLSLFSFYPFCFLFRLYTHLHSWHAYRSTCMHTFVPRGRKGSCVLSKHPAH